MKNCITAVADKICGKQISNKKQEWMTTEILDKRRERKQLKIKLDKKSQKKYREMHRQVQKMCRKAKDHYYNDKCAELEDPDRKHNPKLYTKIKQLTSDISMQ